MRFDWKNIMEGTINSIFVRDSVEKVAEQRMNICKTCDFDSEVQRNRGTHLPRLDHHCTACGCILHLKVRCIACNCGIERLNEKTGSTLPLRWFAQTDQETGNKIDDLIKDNGK